jgi:hypothetical protein
MARVIDAWSSSGAVIAFVVLIVLGGTITLNIVLAVISGSLDKIDHDMDASKAPATTKEKVSDRSAFRRKTEEIIMKYIPKNSMASKKLHEIVESKFYTRFILATILTNTIILSCDHYGISPQFQMALDTGNAVTTAIFFIDCVMSNIAYGICAYWR